MDKNIKHPFLQRDFYIRWSELSAKHVEKDIQTLIETTIDDIDKLSNIPESALNFKNTYQAYIDILEQFNNSWGLVNHLDSVCNEKSLRKALNEMLPIVDSFETNIYLNKKLWCNLKIFEEQKYQDTLSDIEKRCVKVICDTFRASGANLSDDKRADYEKYKSQLALKTQKFSENVLDSENKWELLIENEEDLKGLPDIIKNSILEKAIKKNLATKDNPKWLLTLNAPIYYPVLQYVEKEEIRKKMWLGASEVASKSPYDNEPLIWEILELRQKIAEILGKEHHADVTTELRMAKSGKNALNFVEKLHTKVTKQFKNEYDKLNNYRLKSKGEDSKDLNQWDTVFWIEKLQKELFDFNDEDLRPFFEMSNVINGLFNLCEQLFDIKIIERNTKANQENNSTIKNEEVQTWHDEVRFYEVYDNKNLENDKQNAHLGSFYTDWHPRETKRQGAWMNHFRTGLPSSEQNNRQAHLGVICGNMTAPSKNMPSLLTHNEVITIFHEFGHLIHHILGNVKLKNLNGINVAWDFVELPSQLMENFCWERKSLDLFAKHYKTGEKISDYLLKKLQDSRKFMSASSMMRQLAFSKLDLDLHINYKTYKDKKEDIDKVLEKMLKDYQVKYKTKVPHMIRRFNHIFSSPIGYSAGYYSYKWAEVLEADAFTKFRDNGVNSQEVGLEYRNKILSKGNSSDPNQLFEDFMGRKPNPDALLERDGIEH